MKSSKIYPGILLLIMAVVLGCRSQGPEDPDSELTFLALGDSYTIGEGVDPGERWPVQLVDSLRRRGISVKKPTIVARTGWTTEDLLKGMDTADLAKGSYDLISVSIGVNNQYQGLPIEQYEKELRLIIEKAVRWSREGNKGVIAVSIPDYGATPFGARDSTEISREIASFNAVLRRVAQEYEVPFFNITPISRKAIQQPHLLASDSLHPSGAMYSLWIESMVAEVSEKLTELKKE